MMTKEEEIKKIITELIPLLSLEEKNNLIGFLNGLLAGKKLS